MANLLQINSALGRALESIDRTRIGLAIYPALLRARAAGVEPALIANAIAAGAEGYAFPTNLDRDQPVGRLTPTTQAELVATALDEGASADVLAARLAEHAARRLTH